MRELKTVKVEEEDFKKIIEAKKRLLIKGVESLPDSYKELIRKEVEEEGGKFTNGLIVNIGMTLLLSALS